MNRRIEEEMNRGPDENCLDEDLFIWQLYEKLPLSSESSSTVRPESSSMRTFQASSSMS